MKDWGRFLKEFLDSTEGDFVMPQECWDQMPDNWKFVDISGHNVIGDRRFTVEDVKELRTKK